MATSRGGVSFLRCLRRQAFFAIGVSACVAQTWHRLIKRVTWHIITLLVRWRTPSHMLGVSRIKQQRIARAGSACGGCWRHIWLINAAALARGAVRCIGVRNIKAALLVKRVGGGVAGNGVMVAWLAAAVKSSSTAASPSIKSIFQLLRALLPHQTARLAAALRAQHFSLLTAHFSCCMLFSA